MPEYKHPNRKYKEKAWYKQQRQKSKESYYSSSGTFPRRNWTDEEEEVIMTSTQSDKELSRLLSRSVKSIQVHRSKLHKEGAETVQKASEKNPERRISYRNKEQKNG